MTTCNFLCLLLFRSCRLNSFTTSPRKGTYMKLNWSMKLVLGSCLFLLVMTGLATSSTQVEAKATVAKAEAGFECGEPSNIEHLVALGNGEALTRFNLKDEPEKKLFALPGEYSKEEHFDPKRQYLFTTLTTPEGLVKVTSVTEVKACPILAIKPFKAPPPATPNPAKG